MQQEPARDRSFDALRYVFLCLIVVYHAGLVYGAPAWRVTSPEQSGAALFVSHMAAGVHLAGFFMLAGLFARGARGAGLDAAAGWLAGRARRLLVPCLATMVLLNPIQIAAPVLAEPGPDRGARLLAAFASPGAWIAHAWFLLALFQMSALLALAGLRSWPGLSRLLAAPPAAVICAAALGTGLWLALVSILLAQGLARYPLFGLLRVGDLLQFGPFFLFGLALARAPALRAAYLRPGAPGLAAGGLAIAAWAGGFALGLPQGPVTAALSGVYAILGGRLIFAMAAAWLDRPSAVERAGRELGLLIYLVHQPVLVALAVLLLGWPGDPAVEWIGLSLATLALSTLAARGIAAAPPLALLFAGKRARAAPRRPAPT